jgi:hypothetical protein
MRTLFLALTMVAFGLASSFQTFGQRRDRLNSPIGSWVKIETGHSSAASLTITEDKLTWADGGDLMEADFSTTKDSILFGIVTKASGRGLAKGPAEDDTFSFRYRADADELNVRGLKGFGTEGLSRMAGRYKLSPDSHGQPIPPRGILNPNIK